MKVKNCNKCPFMVNDYNPDSAGYDTYLYCNLKRFNHKISVLAAYDSFSSRPTVSIPDNCPLHKEKIVVELFG